MTRDEILRKLMEAFRPAPASQHYPQRQYCLTKNEEDNSLTVLTFGDIADVLAEDQND